jgi:threonine aldolase
MVDRLPEDHHHARLLAEGLAQTPGIAVDPAAIQTNIVICRPTSMTSERFIADLADQGVRAANYWGGLVRFVTHHGIERTHIDYTLAAVRAVMAGPE